MNGERRLWLVRHGETEGQSSVRFHGSNDVALSDVGRAQVRALAPWLANVPFVRVVHSPLRRAAESARILAAECGLSAQCLCADERWREISFGACEGMTAEEIAAAHPDFWRAHVAGAAEAFPGGEARSTFAARIAAAVDDLVRERGPATCWSSATAAPCGKRCARCSACRRRSGTRSASSSAA